MATAELKLADVLENVDVDQMAADVVEGLTPGSKVEIEIGGRISEATAGEVKADPDESAPTSNELAARRRKQEREADAEREVQSCEQDLNDAKSVVKDAKARLDAAISNLRRIVRSPWDERELPFGDQPEEAGEQASTAGPDPALELSIIELGLTEKETDKLLEAGIDTVGDLEERMKRNPEFWMRDIKGFGEAKIEKLLEAHRLFRVEHPFVELVPVVAEDQEDEDVGDETDE